ncbi:Protein diaphanous 2 [Ameca splendens]|uniref:Protein diaphanous 2 n=1 Tax=Ameca splendens TaxID=208324 RepID=A0ABV0YX75_9TELE
MNLNEERKAPLRGKDLSTKREMVVQYISATAKSITGSKVAGFIRIKKTVRPERSTGEVEQRTVTQPLLSPRSHTNLAL